MLKKIIFFSYSIVFILTLLYFLLYIYTFLTLEKSTQYKFSSLEIINFYKDYKTKEVILGFVTAGSCFGGYNILKEKIDLP